MEKQRVWGHDPFERYATSYRSLVTFWRHASTRRNQSFPPRIPSYARPNHLYSHSMQIPPIYPDRVVNSCEIFFFVSIHDPFSLLTSGFCLVIRELKRDILFYAGTVNNNRHSRRPPFFSVFAIRLMIASASTTFPRLALRFINQRERTCFLERNDTSGPWLFRARGIRLTGKIPIARLPFFRFSFISKGKSWKRKNLEKNVLSI